MAQQLPKQISDKEIVGRRAFGTDKSVFSLTGAILQYRIDVFMDDRLEDDLSVDRLGVRKPDSDRMSHLNALGSASGAKQEKPFRGWVTLPVKELKVEVRITPAEGEENPYHAEISRENHRNAIAARSLAFELCVIASAQKFLSAQVAEQPVAQAAAETGQQPAEIAAIEPPTDNKAS